MNLDGGRDGQEWCSGLCPHYTTVLGCKHNQRYCSAFHIHLGIWTLVLMLGQQAPLPTNESPKHWRPSVLVLNLQCFIELTLTPLWTSIIVTGKMCHVVKKKKKTQTASLSLRSHFFYILLIKIVYLVYWKYYLNPYIYWYTYIKSRSYYLGKYLLKSLVISNCNKT